MKINKIKINNFKSVYDSFEINFDDVKGFWKISGAVGSGKTTIGEAIIFGLFGTVNGKNNSDLISWGQKHGLVELWCESNNNNIYIRRELNMYGQSPVYIEINGEELMTSNKRDAQDKLENEYYDTSKMVLELLCIISFNNFKSLASLNSSDTKKFLDQILGFYLLTQYANACKELKQSNDNLINDCRREINSNQSQVNKLIEMSRIEAIGGNIEETKNELNNLNERKKHISNEFSEKTKSFQTHIEQLCSKINEITHLGTAKSKEIELIKKGVCPTCGARIDDSSLSDKKKEKELLSEQYKSTKNTLDRERLAYNNYVSENHVVNKELDAQIIETATKLAKLEEQLKRTDITTNEIDQLNSLIYDLNTKMTEYKLDGDMWSELYGILSVDARSKILSSFIPILNDNIQKYSQLLQLPYTITFDDMFKCNIEIFGVENKIPISSLSTGQLKIVDMVVILGFLGTIFGGNGINVIFLDELFSNLDEELRENMCQILKQTMSPNKTIFIISHQDINSQIFNGEIKLKLEPNGVCNKTLAEIKNYKNYQ